MNGHQLRAKAIDLFVNVGVVCGFFRGLCIWVWDNESLAGKGETLKLMLQLTGLFEFILSFFCNLKLGNLCLLREVHCGVGGLAPSA